MKIAGIKKGSNHGEVIELAHHKKLEEALKSEVTKLPDTNGDYAGMATFAVEPKVESFSFTAKGQPLKGKWQNNAYIGAGSVVIHRRKLDTDRVLAPVTASFELKFEDSLDSWGMPDLKVTALKFV